MKNKRKLKPVLAFTGLLVAVLLLSGACSPAEFQPQDPTSTTSIVNLTIRNGPREANLVNNNTVAERDQIGEAFQQVRLRDFFEQAHLNDYFRAVQEQERQAALRRAEEARAAEEARQTITETTRPTQRAEKAPSTSGGGGGGTLACIRRHESDTAGGYGAVSGSGKYRGAYQFDQRTWESIGGSGDPATASPAEQDRLAAKLLEQRGTQPWAGSGC